ncbi:hypothetical protein Kpho02_34790 [Kitasatospora phosalacinea]|uniref:Uncharacterized protein n=1 Tax=Kitasatospora phosalacinea TaxID=2065 RepID=A0A9W6V3K3_9ACTN|nr:hypothetical protein [Kitasatospora phosalacinea]GLW71180.1 hypothetical protein Kpho02_34790 [Kitasatospora phosalacinea]
MEGAFSREYRAATACCTAVTFPTGFAALAVRGLPATVLLRGLSSGTFFTLEAVRTRA